jgi:hypothetical protein
LKKLAPLVASEKVHSNGVNSQGLLEKVHSSGVNSLGLIEKVRTKQPTPSGS